ncbi:hypothetical protein [Streptomyces violascens]|uniref:hypothetical protein n=1 Tax=Streptomyces violascens TaxID=67381 RepID=UPI00364CEAEE
MAHSSKGLDVGCWISRGTARRSSLAAWKVVVGALMRAAMAICTLDVDVRQRSQSVSDGAVPVSMCVRCEE